MIKAELSTSPGKNRGDIIEEKWNQGRQVNSRAQRKRPKEKSKEKRTKCPNAASSCHQTRIIERKYLSKVQSLVHEACRGASRDHGASLFLRLGFDVVGEPRLESGAVRVSACLDSVKGEETPTSPSKIPVPSVATLGATYHSLSFNLVNWSC